MDIESLQPVLVVSAQPTLDRVASVQNFEAGKTFRISPVLRLPSGKAINVARSLRRLGFPVRVTALLGGFSGRWIYQAVEALGIPVSPVWVEGENRTAYTVFDPDTHKLTQLIEDDDGPILEENWSDLKNLVRNILPVCSSLVLSGRGSVGFPVTGYQELIEIAHACSKPIYIDCYGPLLEKAMKSRPTVLKINVKEAEDILGCSIPSAQASVQASANFLRQDVKIVVITRGEAGAVAITKEYAWQAIPPVVAGVNVGSGDAFLAGFVYGLSQQRPVKEALMYGTAAGSANVLVPGAGLFDMAALNLFLNQIKIIRLDT